MKADECCERCVAPISVGWNGLGPVGISPELPAGEHPRKEGVDEDDREGPDIDSNPHYRE